MALFNRKKIQQKEKIEQGVREYYELLPFYSPAFRTFEGSVYEMAYTRACIHTFANACSKLKPEVKGQNNTQLERILQYRPNPLMDTKKYLYRLATIVKTKNNAFIVPLYDKYYQKIVGFYPLHPDKCEIKKVDNEPWLYYDFVNGEKRAVKLAEIGILNQFQNVDELFGDSNFALNPTLKMMNAQDQAVVEAINNSANIKLLAKMSQTLKDKSIEEERQRFVDFNFKKNKSAVMVIDGKYDSVTQLDVKQFTVDDKQMKLIQDNCLNYFGVSEKLIQNNYSPDEWNAYYEGQIEPFALELGLTHTHLAFTEREQSFGNFIEFASNRMNYLPINDKVNVIQTMMDRGMMTRNEGREILNLSHIDDPDADRFYIRAEYTQNYDEVKDNDTNEQNEVEE